MVSVRVEDAPNGLPRVFTMTEMAYGGYSQTMSLVARKKVATKNLPRDGLSCFHRNRKNSR